MTAHHAWASIDNFHTLRKFYVDRENLLANEGNVTFNAKVKLHGTNAGVYVGSNGDVFAYSRSKIIEPGAGDNCGFAAWVQKNKEFFATMKRECDFVIYGEWCGPGVQKGVAISQIPNRVFAVFAYRDLTNDVLLMEENLLKDIVRTKDDMIIIPDYVTNFKLNILTPAQESLNKIVQIVDEIEKCDPFVKNHWGIEGVGEGLVYYPMTKQENWTVQNYEQVTMLMFKAKGDKHQVLARTKPVQAEATSAETIDAYVDLVLTENRLLQGAKEVSGKEHTYDKKLTGDFIRWIKADIVKETKAEIEAAGLTVEAAAKAVELKARKWYANKFTSQV